LCIEYQVIVHHHRVVHGCGPAAFSVPYDGCGSHVCQQTIRLPLAVLAPLAEHTDMFLQCRALQTCRQHTALHVRAPAGSALRTRIGQPRQCEVCHLARQGYRSVNDPALCLQFQGFDSDSRHGTDDLLDVPILGLHVGYRLQRAYERRPTAQLPLQHDADQLRGLRRAQ
jgi:hypothetical protein